MALVTVLLAMTMASALAVGGVFVTRQLATSARSSQRGAQLEPAAERALIEAVVSWDSVGRSEQPIGSTSVLDSDAPTTGPRVETWITRLSERTYWLVAEARADAHPPLRRRIGLLIQLSGGLPTLVPRRAWSELP